MAISSIDNKKKFKKQERKMYYQRKEGKRGERRGS